MANDMVLLLPRGVNEAVSNRVKQDRLWTTEVVPQLLQRVQACGHRRPLRVLYCDDGFGEGTEKDRADTQTQLNKFSMELPFNNLHKEM